MIEGITAGYLLKQVKDMIFAVGKLRAADHKNAEDISKHDRRLKNLEKRLERNEKVSTINSQELAEVQQQLADITAELKQEKSASHGLKVKLGKAKAALDRDPKH